MLTNNIYSNAKLHSNYTNKKHVEQQLNIVIAMIEKTYKIEFIVGPMDCDIDLFTIKNSIEYGLYYNSYLCILSMKYRYDLMEKQ